MTERPLILLLDDRADARETLRELFESVGCSVIPVATYEAAFAEISRENIDFLVTDINLKSDQNDKTGIMFARMARKIRGDLFIAAYSARVRDLKLTPNEYRAFDLFLDKGAAQSHETIQFVSECKAFAIAHKEMSKKMQGVHGGSSNAELIDLRDRLGTIEARYLRVPDLKPYGRAIYVLLGLLGGLASIVGLYYAIK